MYMYTCITYLVISMSGVFFSEYYYVTNFVVNYQDVQYLQVCIHTGLFLCIYYFVSDDVPTHDRKGRSFYFVEFFI